MHTSWMVPQVATVTADHPTAGFLTETKASSKIWLLKCTIHLLMSPVNVMHKIHIAYSSSVDSWS